MWALLLLAASMGATSASVLQQDAPPQTAATLSERVNRAIARGVRLLRERQSPDGRWSGAENDHPGGMTALCALTLLESGVRRSDPSVQRALSQVLATEFKSTYSHSVRLMLFDTLDQGAALREHAERSLQALIATQQGGVWAYPAGAVDLSNTQFALLGLRAAHRMGLEAPDETLLATLKSLGRWRERESGAFCYDEGKPPTASVTAATLGGYAVLDELSRARPACQAHLRKHEADRKRALVWLAERFDVARNAWGSDAWTPSFHYPYLWAIERYGGLAGQTRIGAHDWYAEGAEWLVAAQENDGSWGKTEDTCFALLFLRRATVSSGGEVEAGDELDTPRVAPVRPAADLLRITDVLAAGPWNAARFGETLLAPPFDPARVRAKEGDKLARKAWRRVRLKSDGWSNFDELLGADCDRGVVAVATSLVWDGAEAASIKLWLDLEDGWDLFLDGARVSSGRRVQGPIDNSLELDLELVPGEHTLVCLVEDALGAAAFGVRISDSNGQRLDGPLRVGVGVEKSAKR